MWLIFSWLKCRRIDGLTWLFNYTLGGPQSLSVLGSNSLIRRVLKYLFWAPGSANPIAQSLIMGSLQEFVFLYVDFLVSSIFLAILFSSVYLYAKKDYPMHSTMIYFSHKVCFSPPAYKRIYNDVSYYLLWITPTLSKPTFPFLGFAVSHFQSSYLPNDIKAS